MMPYREVCTAIQELRDLLEHALPEDRDFSRVKAITFCLLEEIQVHANRMESHLRAQNDYFELKNDIRQLELLKEALEEELDLETE